MTPATTDVEVVAVAEPLQSAERPVVTRLVEQPSSSVSVTFAWRVPSAYVCWTVGVVVVAVVPSPKSHRYDATEPSESVDADASSVTTPFAVRLVSRAVGGWLGRIATDWNSA